MAAKKDPDKEVKTEAEAGVQADPAQVSELRTGLATGSNASNPDQPDGHVLQATVEGLNPDEPSTAEQSVVITADGKKGPAA